MWVKICANTNLADARLAAEMGADAVGFVFAEASSRRVTAGEVALIVQGLPDNVDKVGVFAEMDFATIRDTVEFAALTSVQLHGPYDPALVEALRKEFRARIDILQVLHWKVGAGLEQAEEFESMARLVGGNTEVTRLLVDAKTPLASGGTGTSFDWKMAGPSFAIAKHQTEVILAGGLNPQNVAEAIRTLHPWGVDVASGVESEPGKKDSLKMADFIANAKSA